MKILISLSAIPLPLVIKHVLPAMKGWDRNRYSDIFARYEHAPHKYRIYIPLGGKASTKRIVVPQAVTEKLQSKGYIVEDYVAGLAVKADDPKKKIKIGKLISDDPSVKHMYDNDDQRTGCKGVKQWVVISRHPYDIMGMSFDRGWKSCMHLTEGSNKKYLEQDVKHGTLVAYLINDNDRNINKPVARIAIKPFFDNKGNYKLLPPNADKVYGTASKAFYNTVVKWCKEVNTGTPNGKYTMHPKLYPDNQDGVHTQLVTQEIMDSLKKMTSSEIKEAFSKFNFKERTFIIAETDSENVLMVGAEDENYYIRMDVVKNVNATEKVLLISALDKNENVRESVMFNDNASQKILLIGAQDADYNVRRTVMENVNATKKILLIGAHDKDDYVRRAAMRNINATKKVLLIGAQDEDLYVRKAIMENVNATEKVLLIGAHDGDYSVRKAAMSNHNASEKVILIGAKDKNVIVREEAMYNVNASEKVLLIGAQDKDVDIRKAIMTNVNASEKVLLIGAQDEDVDIRDDVMKNVNASEKVLLIGATDIEWSIRESAMKNVNATEKVLLIGARDEDVDVRRATMGSINVTEKVLLIGAKDNLSDVRESAMYNVNATEKILLIGAHDKDEDVRKAAMRNINATEKILQIVKGR